MERPEPTDSKKYPQGLGSTPATPPADGELGKPDDGDSIALAECPTGSSQTCGPVPLVSGSGSAPA